jgi:hypothetical protein
MIKIYTSLVLTMLLVIFAIDIYILVKMFEIQKSNHNCQCAKNSYVSKILTSVIIMFVLLLFVLLFMIMDNILGEITETLPNLFLTIVFISLFIIYSYSSLMMFKMSKQIEKDRCDCFDSTLKNILKYYSSLRLSPIIIILMLQIYVTINPPSKSKYGK